MEILQLHEVAFYADLAPIASDFRMVDIAVK